MQHDYRPAAFRFTGRASEYFRIWVVHAALTLLTLGVFSAWAKVRTKQYFYRNTVVDGSSFDYVGKPAAILRGRLVACAVLVALYLLSHYSLGVYAGVLAVTLLATPWVLVASIGFNAQNTLYRNIRFQFTGRAREAYVVCAKAALLHVLSCGLAYPYVAFSLTRYVVRRYRWGELPFEWNTGCGRYFGAHVLASCFAVPIYLVLFALAARAREGAGVGGLSGSPLPWLVLFYAYLLIPAAILRARLKNLLYDGLAVGEHVVSADFRAWELLKLYVTNTLLVVLSVGLLIPWARVRAAAYEASCLTLHVRRELVAKVAPPTDRRALGEGFADLGDFELGVGT
jgi:uncharacterized membrane protein YjgN (DUF898 family)